VSGQLHAPAALPPGKEPTVPIGLRGKKKILDPTGTRTPTPRSPKNFFLIGIVGGGVQMGPLGTAATNRPIVPAPGDYDDGEIGGMIGKGNQSTRRKPAPVPLCPPQIPHAARTRTRAAAVGSAFY
jgi:hypothetical protein